MLGGIAAGRMAARSASEANTLNRELYFDGKKFNRNQSALARKYNRAEAATARDFVAGESAAARDFTASQAALDRLMSERFAKRSAGWKFNDLMEAADGAGIHRLAALGAGGGAGYTPVGASAGGGAAAPASAGASMAPGAPDIDPVSTGFLGEAVGGGLAEIADAFQEERRRKELDKRMQRQEARADAIAQSEIKLNLARTEAETADAQLRTARSRTLLREATEAARSPSADGNEAGSFPLGRGIFGGELGDASEHARTVSLLENNVDSDGNRFTAYAGSEPTEALWSFVKDIAGRTRRQLREDAKAREGRQTETKKSREALPRIRLGKRPSHQARRRLREMGYTPAMIRNALEKGDSHHGL
jgi:hypothetical protein